MDVVINERNYHAYTGGRNPGPSLPNVIFVHGAGLDHTVWVLPARYFARHERNVYAIDLPGHGISEGPPCPSIETMADSIVALMDAASLDTAAIVGHSMGSLVALSATARYPERFRALALIGTAAPMPVSDPLLQSAEANDHAAIDMLTYWGYSPKAQMGGNETPGMWMVGGTMRLFERSAPGVLYNDLGACHEYTTGPEDASRVQCPTLFILGEKDIMTPVKRSQALQTQIPGSKTVVFPETGHTLMSEQPDAVLDALIEIL